MRANLINISVSSLVLGGALGACSPQHPVVVGPHRQDSVVAKNESVRIEAASKLWTGAPSDFESYFTPFAIDIDNTSTESLHVDVSEFYLEDDQGRVASALRPNGIREEWLAKPPSNETTEETNVANWQRDDVENALGGTGSKASAVHLPDRLRSGPSPMMGGLAGQLSGHWGWSWNVNREWDEDAKGVVLPGLFRIRALRSHDLEPGQRGVGFVYFPRVQAEQHTVTIHWRPATGEPLSLAFKVKG